jgi:hypothetical protein
MKYILKFLIITIIFINSITLLQAQSPPHPNNGVTPSSGNGNTPVGAGAPVGSGTYILFMLAAAYGGLKVYRLRTEVADENL